MAMSFDPLDLTKSTEAVVVKGELRKYYRVARPGRWYGGIASSDCCGCNLRCVFCWSGVPRDSPANVGRFYSPQQIFESLTGCAKRFGYAQLRVSGNEPTIGRDHLLRLLELLDGTRYSFILETNGILLGHDRSYAKELSRFERVHARVSIKGTNAQEFSRLTGALPESFELQLQALRNLLDAGVPCHPAVMLSFSTEGGLEGLRERLREIQPTLVEELEKEFVFLYPHVVRRLRAAKVQPLTAYEPTRVPPELV